MKRKISKAIISLVVVFVMLFGTFAVSSNVLAFNYPKISFSKSVNGNLEDYFGDVSYELNLSSKTKVKIEYSSTASSDFYVYDEKFNTIFSEKATKKVKKTITLKSGTYVLSIYNATYSKGTYSLNLTDKTVYAKSLQFEKENYTLSVGKNERLKVVKEPNWAKVQNYEYSSSNNSVATVNSNGKVSAVGLGTAIITVKTERNVFADCTVVVGRMDLNVFRNSKKNLAKLKSGENYISSDNSVASVFENSVKGVSQGRTTVIKYSDGEQYTINVKVTSHKRLKKAGLKLLKKQVSNPDSLLVLHTYRGYDSNRRACVVFDYAVKSSSGISQRGYFVCNYTNNFSLNYKYASTLPKLKNKKEIK